MNETSVKVDNGVNVEALLGARKALTDTPEAARFKWRATCSWSTVAAVNRPGFWPRRRQGSQTRFRYDASHPGFSHPRALARHRQYVLVGLAS